VRASQARTSSGDPIAPRAADVTHRYIASHGWRCASCGHRHMGESKGFICIGCGCASRHPTFDEFDAMRTTIFAPPNAEDL
jgi:hypothetical protein